MSSGEGNNTSDNKQTEGSMGYSVDKLNERQTPIHITDSMIDESKRIIDPDAPKGKETDNKNNLASLDNSEGKVNK